MTEDEAMEALFNLDPSFIDLSSEMETDESNLISPTTEDKQAFIDQMAAEMEFLYSNAATTNTDDTLETIDLNVLRAQYGNNPIFDEIEAITKTPEARDLTSYVKCVGGGLLKSVGITALKKAFNKSAIKALKSFAWKKASAIIFNNLVKIIGKKATQFVIKKVAHSILPGSLAVTLAWNAAKCLPKLPQLRKECFSMMLVKRILVFLLIDVIVAAAMAVSYATTTLIFNGENFIHSVVSSFPLLLLVAPVYLGGNYLWDQRKQGKARGSKNR